MTISKICHHGIFDSAFCGAAVGVVCGAIELGAPIYYLYNIYFKNYYNHHEDQQYSSRIRTIT
jgi:hypothetical protein